MYMWNLPETWSGKMIYFSLSSSLYSLNFIKYFIINFLNKILKFNKFLGKNLAPKGGG